MKKTLALAAGLLPATSAALAHPGPHLHPHGDSVWLPYWAIAAALVAAVALAILYVGKER